MANKNHSEAFLGIQLLKSIESFEISFTNLLKIYHKEIEIAYGKSPNNQFQAELILRETNDKYLFPYLDRLEDEYPSKINLLLNELFYLNQEAFFSYQKKILKRFSCLQKNVLDAQIEMHRPMMGNRSLFEFSLKYWLEIQFVFSRIEEKIQKFTPQILTQDRSKVDKKISFNWNGIADKELPELYSLMIEKYKLIASENTYEQFEAVFTGQPIDEITPVRWHQDNASELLYFIHRLEQTENIAHNPKKADYQKMTACFVKPDGKPFAANWKQLKQNIDINLSKDKQKAIDDLINNF